MVPISPFHPAENELAQLRAQLAVSSRSGVGGAVPPSPLTGRVREWCLRREAQRGPQLPRTGARDRLYQAEPEGRGKGDGTGCPGEGAGKGK